MSFDTSISTDKLSRLIGITNAPALVDVRINGDFAAGPRLIPGATRRSRLDVQDWALQRFPFIRDHSVIQVHVVNRYERETPQIPQLTHVLVGEQRFALANRIHFAGTCYSVGTHLESRIRFNGLDTLRSRPGVRFAPSGLRTALDERVRRSPDGASGSRECANRRRNPGDSHRWWMRPSPAPQGGS